jgi:outer membrane receptor for ferrienterochelin and colicins
MISVTKRRTFSFLIAVLFLSLLPSTAAAQGTATLTGTVVDAQDGSTLIGANVALRKPDAAAVVSGAATGTDGAFRFDEIPPGEYVLEVRFVGYQTQQRTLALDAGESRNVTVELPVSTSSLETIVVSASRQQEKVLDAPASISVLQPEEIGRQTNTSTVEAIRSAPGVDVAQTGIDRREVVLRGFNEAFSGATYVLTDYRQAAVPSLAVNVHSLMPNMSLDVERIEVVRGPGSALYGPGVDSGVIHYFTKDPFQHSGTSVSVSGGTRQYISGQFRNAGTFTDNLGWKVTAQYARADEWELNPGDRPDSLEIARYRVYQSRDQVPSGRTVATDDFDEDGADEFQLRREDTYQKLNVNGLLQYRSGDATTISLNGGYSELKSVVQSGIGTLQADGFGYAYGQLRVRSGGLFGQVYLNANESGDNTYVYGSGDEIVDKGLQWNGQLQYDFDVPQIGTQVVAGADADITIPRTEGEILGRNEGDDDIQEYGAYTQTTTDLTGALELTLAGRLDYNNVVEEVQISPRAALVYTATPQNTFRASYNRSFSSPGTNSLFLDIESLRRPLPGGNALVFQGLGAADGFSFNQFRESQAAASLLPVNYKDPIAANNVPLRPLFGTVVEGLASAVQSGNFGQLPEPLQGLSPNQLDFLVRQLRQLNMQVEATTDGQLGIPNDSERGFRPVDGPVDIPPLDQTKTQTFEVGYKGVLGGRVIVNVDAYYEQKEDFIGPLVVESPLLYVDPQDVNASLATELTPILEEAAEENLQLLALIQRFGGAQQVADFLAGVTSDEINQGPVGVVQPDQDVLAGRNPDAVGAMLSYRNFGSVEYWGIDASVQARVTDQLDAFANVSVVSDDFFDNEELDEENSSLSLALNAPSFKAKGGVNYRFDGVGLSVGASGNYVEGFPVETGPYVGDVDSYFLLDAHLGYEFGDSFPGLSANLTGKNILNNEHREFVGAPELGFMLMGRLTYELP